ncbi:uncharacterized protein TNCV_1290411 [Trichonephila clavipes]|nr:uncharacterized protein TNCV_1290411 [Trichonephila clavipes]
MHHHTCPAPSIMVWGNIEYHSRTPLVRIADTLNSQRYISEALKPVNLPYLQGLATAIFQQNNVQTHVACIVQRFFVNHQIKASLPLSLSPSFTDKKHVVHRCSTIDPDYTSSCHTRSTLLTCGGCLVCCTPRTHPKSLNQCRGVWQ